MKTVWNTAVTLVAAAFVALIWTAKHHGSPEAIHLHAQEVIMKAGGPEEICSQGNQFFAKFGTSKLKFFKASEIKDYPAIAALGTVDGIFPDEPPYIKVRVGNHFTGFAIEIMDVRQRKLATQAHNVELIEPCLLIHN
jgi:hypothetical protein